MKKIKLLLLFGLCTASTFSSKSQVENRAKTLSFTRITSGLNVPTFEGGRTDFAMNDINDDGHVDLLSIGDHGSPFINSTQHGIMVWFNDGQGNFNLHMEGNFGYGGIAVGDVNNDGFKDVGYGMHHAYSSTNLGNQLIEVALGDGTGTSWIPWDKGLATNGETWGMFGTDFGDVNNNGLLDLVSTSFGCCAGFHVYLNQGDGSWIPSFGILGNNSEFVIQFADLNNNGFLDFVAAHALGTAWFGDGNGNFVKNDNGLPPLGEFTPRYGISVGDINNDGSSGIAFTNLAGGVEAWEWNTNTSAWISYSGNLPSSGPYERTQLFDMNADGFTDLVAFGNRSFQIWLGDGNGNWTADAAFQTNETPGSARAFRVGGDLNKNGHGDVVMLVNERIGFLNWINRLYVYTENTVAQEMNIRGLYPKGNERFFPGTVRFIEWASAVPQAATSHVKIEISAFGSEGPWWLVADSLPNNGKYQWTVPETGSDDCFLRFTVTSANEQTSSITSFPFTIIGEPTSVSVSKDLSAVIDLLPNPGKDIIIINTLHEVERITLFDLAGKKVLELDFPATTVATGHLPEGVYIYTIHLKNGLVANGKWIKQN